MEKSKSAKRKRVPEPGLKNVSQERMSAKSEVTGDKLHLVLFQNVSQNG